jgi:hypothetical protein
VRRWFHSLCFRALLVVGLALPRLTNAPQPASAPTSAPETKPHCGEAAWTIRDLKSEKTLFNGKADCTTVEFNGWLNSIMDAEGDRLILQIHYDVSGSSSCGDDGDRIHVTLAGVSGTPAADPNYTAWRGNVPPTSCDLSVSDLPRGPGVVRGGLNGVLGRCPTGGCASRKASDWDLVSVNGSFNAYFRGR